MFRGFSLFTGFCVALFACSDASESTGPASTPGSGGSGAGSSGGSGASSGGVGGSSSGGTSSGAQGGTLSAGSGGTTIGIGGSGGLGEGCANASYVGEQLPLDLYILLDRSTSMLEVDSGASQDRWTQVTSALQEFMAYPESAGIGVGIGFFPVAPSQTPPTSCMSKVNCAPYDLDCVLFQCVDNAIGGPPTITHSCYLSDYQAPAQTIAELPGAAAAITSSINGNTPVTGSPTPMAPALEGAIDYATTSAAANPDHVTAVVLVSDGIPDSCNPGSLDTVVARAEEGLNQSPSVLTFVIGLTAVGTLSEIAAAGGTNFALAVEPGSNAGASFLEALDEIRGSLGCAFTLPDTPPDEPLDPELLNVAFTPEGQDQDVYFRVDSESECGGNRAWYYDNPANPTSVQLCPAACSQVSKKVGQVDVVLGCPPVRVK